MFIHPRYEPLKFSPEISRALAQKLPVVALESTVITHGLPRPQNLNLAQDMESTVRENGALPATVAVMEGFVRVGINQSEMEKLAHAPDPVKVSLRDFAASLSQKTTGGTTVAGTMFAAHRAGIRVFATGGIGGVHREARFDVSTDLKALASIPTLVVCAGAKRILDLPATLEYLETMGVPVVGYQTNKFPEFYVTGRQLPVSVQLDDPLKIVEFAHYHWNVLGMNSAILVCQQVDPSHALDASLADDAEAQASKEIREKGIRGQAVTPYELGRVAELTNGKSMRSNIELLKNNASLAAKIAVAMQAALRQKAI